MTDRSAPRPRVLCGEPVKTLAEIAAELGISAERARQLEANGLRKLRRYMDERNLTLKDFID